jgi:hypothetical protein
MIIGISGLAGSGKDTAADFLVQNHGFTKTHFAAPIKEYCGIVFQFTHAQLWGPSSNRNAEDLLYRHPAPWGAAEDRLMSTAEDWLIYIGLDPAVSKDPLIDWFKDLRRRSLLSGAAFSPRVALQTLGTEFGRAQKDDIWVAFAVRDARNNKVIPDVRFRNEMDGIRNAGGHLIRMKRGTGLSGDQAVHQSETEQLGVEDSYFSAVIQNNDITLRKLEEEITKVFNLLC